MKARTDSNHQEIVKAFRKFGCTVVDLACIGGGCPDIAVGKCKKTVLVEIKDGNKPPSARELTKDELKFHQAWLGSLFIVKCLDDVIAIVKALER